MPSLLNTYPRIECDLLKLRKNAEAFTARARAAGVDITAVVKGFNALPDAARVYDAVGFKSIASSRMEQLRAMREDGIRAELMLIRVPMLSELSALVHWADISLHSDLTVLRALNEEAGRIGRRHKVLLMVDLGDLREGFWERGELLEAAQVVEQELAHLDLLGLGTNLGCYGTVRATPEKMNELIAAAEAVEERIGRRLELISGGASSSVEMLLNGTLPPRINHLRVGELMLRGETWGCEPDCLHKDVFTLRAEVVETRVKASHPVGELTVDAFGSPRSFVDRGMRRRALVAIGRVDYADIENLTALDAGVEILGASSDHTIVDIEDAQRSIAVGDTLTFGLCYASVVYLTSSPNVQPYCLHREEALRGN